MNAKNTQSEPKRHAIQLVSLKVIELFIKAKSVEHDDVRSDQFDFSIGHTEYDPDKKVIIVGVKLGIGSEEDSQTPFELRVELAGLFKVDESKFDIKHLNHWAEHNAPLILYPYIREHAYSLTSRAGFNPILLPLFEVPTIRIQK